MESENSKLSQQFKVIVNSLSLPLEKEIVLLTNDEMKVTLSQSDTDNSLRVSGQLAGDYEPTCLGEISFTPELRTEQQLRVEIKAIRNLMSSISNQETGSIDDVARRYLDRYKVSLLVAEAVQAIASCSERFRKEMIAHLLSEQDALDKEIEAVERQLSDKMALLSKDKNYVPDEVEAKKVLKSIKDDFLSGSIDTIKVLCVSAFIDKQNSVGEQTFVIWAEKQPHSNRVTFITDSKCRLTQVEVLKHLTGKVVSYSCV